MSYSQYFPFHAKLAVGAKSWLLYHFNDSPLRRKGAMTTDQRARRAEIERRFGCPDAKAVEVSTVALLKPLLLALPPQGNLFLHSDDHPAYSRALRQLRTTDVAGPGIVSYITSSQQRRTQSNPLFPVNLADLLLRHGSANHRRETIAFSRRRQAALERMAIFTVWRNCITNRRENAPSESSAMHVGLLARLLDWRAVLPMRLFPEHTRLPEPWESYYWRRVKTVVLGSRRTTHRCRFAF